MDINNRPAWIAEHLESQYLHSNLTSYERDEYISMGYDDNMMGRPHRDTSRMTPVQARAYQLGWNRAERDQRPAR